MCCHTHMTAGKYLELASNTPALLHFNQTTFKSLILMGQCTTPPTTPTVSLYAMVGMCTYSYICAYMYIQNVKVRFEGPLCEAQGQNE